MNESKRKLIATIKVIDILLEQKRISNDQGTSVSGSYWFDIKMAIRDTCMANLNKEGLSCIFQESLLSYKEKCNETIHEINRQEYERNLDEKYKLVHIKNVKRAYILSIIAIIISIIAATIALCQLQGWKIL